MADDDDLRLLGGALDMFDATDRLRKLGEQHKKDMRKLLCDVLVVLDGLRDLERYCLQLEETGQEKTQLSNVQTISKMVLRLIGNHGVEPMDATGCPLDLARHEVVGVSEEAGTPPDIVLSESQHGYMIASQVLRQAKVIISR